MSPLFTKKKSIVTHSGAFHADDVFACATLYLLHDGKIDITRSRDNSVIASADIVVDVGGVYDPVFNRFDHHQKGGAGARPNGIPYASFGLVWKTYGRELCGGSGKIADALDARIVETIDAGDNGITTFVLIPERPSPYLIHNLFSAFMPTWKENQQGMDKAFMDMVLLTSKLLKREIIQMHDILEGQEYVRGVYTKTEDKRVIILDKRSPWEEVMMQYPEPLFVIAPRPEETWKIEGVFSEKASFKRRLYLPESWAGKQGNELREVTGVPDAIFCHNGRFIAVAGSREGAEALGRIALKQ